MKTGLKRHTQTKLYRNHGSRQPRQPRCDSVTHSITPSALRKLDEQEKNVDDGICLVGLRNYEVVW
jgi:hypothetical protein